MNHKRRIGFDRRFEQLDAFVEKRSGYERRDFIRHRQVLIAKLKNTKLFGNMDNDQLMRLLLIASKVELEQGDILMKAGDEVDGMYAVLDGRLRVECRNNILATLTPVSFAGELEIVTGNVRMATVIAESDCRLMCFSVGELDAVFEKDRDLYSIFLAGMISDVSKKLGSLNQTIARIKNTVNL